jgi:hypothetical protein
MKLGAWFKKRGIRFIFERAKKLNERYGIRPNKAIQRIEQCVDSLRDYGCSPTFFVPGMVVERNRAFIQRLQGLGAEIGVHGYNHVDLKVYPPEDGSRQLQHAAQVFRASKLEVHGFRCPYLSATDALIQAAPADVFGYSSNKAIQWPVGTSAEKAESLLFETVEGFYAPVRSETNLCLPWLQDGIVEIPVCVPDDLQLHDGLGYDLEQVSRIWLGFLHETYRRGEVFNLMFHPELATFCESPLLAVLQETHSLPQKVWLARLRDVSAWWKEKSAFRVEIQPTGDRFNIRVRCTPRATVLCRGFDPNVPARPWDERYSRLEAGERGLDCAVLPLIGLPAGAPRDVVSALERMGYIVETRELARSCSLFLDDDCLKAVPNPVDLIAYIESWRGPLLRFWPWPDGMRSALCITGDLDALSLLDYASRLLKK